MSAGRSSLNFNEIESLKQEIKSFNKRIESGEACANLYYLKANKLKELGDLTGDTALYYGYALNAYNKAIELDSKDSLCLVYRGRLYDLMNKKEEAEKDFAIIKSRLESGEIKDLLLRHLLQNAFEDHIRSLSNPSSASSTVKIDIRQAGLSEKDVKATIEQNQKLQQEKQGYIMYTMFDGNGKSKNESNNDLKSDASMDRKKCGIAELQKKIESYDRFLKDFPNNANAHSQKARAMYELAELMESENDKSSYIKQALTSFDMAINLDKTKRMYLVDKMKIYADIGEYDKAKEILGKVKNMEEDYYKVTAMHEGSLIKKVEETLANCSSSTLRK